MTEQRRAILAAFKHGERPLSPDELHSLANQHVRKINLTTIYRNLKAMLEQGEIVAVAMLGKSTRYELSGLDHHHHFLCDKCDRVFDIPGCPGSMQSHAPEGFAVHSHELMLIGCCRSCV